MTDRHDLTVPQADALWDAIAIPGPRQATFVEQHERTCKTVARLLNERPFQEVQGRCPACRGSSLFLGEGGHVTCSRLDCPNPSAADQLLHEEALNENEERDWFRTGRIPCSDCGTTVRTETLETLPAHNCTARQRACREREAADRDTEHGPWTATQHLHADTHQPKEQPMPQPACTARIEGPHVIGGGKTLWTDGNAGATPHQEQPGA